MKSVAAATLSGPTLPKGQAGGGGDKLMPALGADDDSVLPERVERPSRSPAPGHGGTHFPDGLTATAVRQMPEASPLMPISKARDEEFTSDHP